jgi:hypothetical protein
MLALITHKKKQSLFEQFTYKIRVGTIHRYLDYAAGVKFFSLLSLF